MDRMGHEISTKGTPAWKAQNEITEKLANELNLLSFPSELEDEKLSGTQRL